MRQPGIVAAVGLYVAAALTACEGGSAVERGFESRQLLSTRDPTISIGQWWGNVWAYNLAGEYWSLDLDTGETRDLGLTPPGISNIPGSGARYDCEEQGDVPPFTLTITDKQSGKATVIDRIVESSWCPTESDPTIDVWREDDAGKLSLWTGPYDHIAAVPLDVNVSSVIFQVSHAATNGKIGYVVYGARPSQPEGVGVFAIDPPEFASQEIVPAALGTASWATGATPEGPLTSASLSERPPLIFTATGSHGYGRIMSDGGVTMFVGPFTSEPSELALFRLSDSAQIQLVSLQSQGVHTTWRSHGVAAGDDTFIDWNARRQQLTTCPSPSFDRVFVVADPDEDWLAVSAAPPGLQAMSGPLVMMGAGVCTTLATADVTAFRFSTDGTATAWLVQPPRGDATLWIGGRGGSGPRVAGTGALAGPPNAPRFVGPAELELQLGGDLAWIDVHDDPVRMHYIAERVFGEAIDIGGWLVMGYELVGQDATGTVGVVDRHTGAKRLISREVSSYAVVGATPGSNPSFLPPLPEIGAGPVRVLYVVRGRNPSPQDGIWIATITQNGLD